MIMPEKTRYGIILTDLENRPAAADDAKDAFTAGRSTAHGKEPPMGDKGGKKDKNKMQKQVTSKQEQKAKTKQDKQPKSGV